LCKNGYVSQVVKARTIQKKCVASGCHIYHLFNGVSCSDLSHVFFDWLADFHDQLWDNTLADFSGWLAKTDPGSAG
jgi:type IV secretory pathway TrbD component